MHTATSGSTIITLKASYLNMLSVGKHTLTAEYSDGTIATGTFTVTAAAASMIVLFASKLATKRR